ncbi:hypothetical protein D3C80_2083300 [compost metagenome]
MQDIDEAGVAVQHGGADDHSALQRGADDGSAFDALFGQHRHDGHGWQDGVADAA